MENTPRRQIVTDVNEPTADSTDTAAITRLEDECEFVGVANKPQHHEPVIAALRIGPRSHIRRIPALAVDINPYEEVEIVLNSSSKQRRYGLFGYRHTPPCSRFPRIASTNATGRQ